MLPASLLRRAVGVAVAGLVVLFAGAAILIDARESPAPLQASELRSTRIAAVDESLAPESTLPTLPTTQPPVPLPPAPPEPQPEPEPEPAPAATTAGAREAVERAPAPAPAPAPRPASAP